jgi:hypothetical protein
MTSWTGPLGQNIWDRTARRGQFGTGQSGQDSLNRSARSVSLERTEMAELPDHDRGVRRAVDKVAWAGQLEQGS